MADELALYNPSDKSIVVYQSEDNTLQLNVQVKGDTVWLTQQQIAEYGCSNYPNCKFILK